MSDDGPPWTLLPPTMEHFTKVPGCSTCLIPLEPTGWDGDLGCDNNFRGNKHGRWKEVELLIRVVGHREY